jgi:hypothetical protein
MGEVSIIETSDDFITPAKMATILIGMTLNEECNWLVIEDKNKMKYLMRKNDMRVELTEDLKFSIWCAGEFMKAYTEACDDDVEFNTRLGFLKIAIERSKQV